MQNQLPYRGVYFLANDRVYEQTIAFLNSFRTYNTKERLCLIPFDSECSKIKSLQLRYDFDIYSDQTVLNACDEISKKFHGRVCGAYRKLAAWEGAFDEFIYIDVDTVVLRNVNFSFRSLEFTDIATSHSNIPDIRKHVWHDTIYDNGFLSLEQIEFSANTGFIVARKSSLRLDYVLTRIEEALTYKEHMELHCMEQPFLNFLFVTSGKKYNSFSNLNATEYRAKFPWEYWAGAPGAIIIDGKIFSMKNPTSYFLVHWAGQWTGKEQTPDKIPYYDLWTYYRYMEEFQNELMA